MLGIFFTEPFYTTYINLPDAHTPLSQRIHNNPKMSPFFDCALGALNGCHITCAPPSYRNQKGFISQNCLFACDFDLQFMFCYTRWEGSVTDAQVLEGELQAGLEIPNGYYYLANVGYLLLMSLLIRYTHIPFYFCFSFTSSTSLIHHYALISSDRSRLFDGHIIYNSHDFTSILSISNVHPPTVWPIMSPHTTWSGTSLRMSLMLTFLFTIHI